MFVTLDGLDGSGKSTQCRRLAAWLRERGRTVVEAVDPGGTPLGGELRAILLQHRQSRNIDMRAEALLFMASRAQLVAEVIRPALAGGADVVCDRFTLANVVYQGHAGGLPVEDLWAVGEVATGGLSPDLTLVFDLPVSEARARRGRPADRVESRNDDYFERVRAGFLAEAKRCDRTRVIDASRPEEIVFADVSAAVAPLLERA